MSIGENPRVTRLTSNPRGFRELSNIILQIVKLEEEALYLTRLLKLLYIIDENSVKKIGNPVTFLDYKVAKNGPLAEDLWYCIQYYPDIFADYFTVKYHPKSSSYSLKAKPSKSPDLNLLSEFEEDLIKSVVKSHKSIPTGDIINKLHKRGTLWHDIKSKNKIVWNDESSAVSKFVIDFSKLVKGDNIRSDAYENFISTKA